MREAAQANRSARTTLAVLEERSSIVNDDYKASLSGG